MSRERLIRTSADTWRLLRGCLVLYKPSGVTMAQVRDNTRERLTEELNEMDLGEKEEALRKKWGFDPFARSPSASKILRGTQTGLAHAEEERHVQDYSLHPLVLGRGFHQDDIRLYFANPMTYRQCGLIVSTINRRNLCRSVQTSSMPRTYRVLGEFGRATDSGWTDGKTLEKSQNLRLKPAQVAKALASIAGSHQKEAFSLSKVSLQSQQAYELAARGPIKPSVGTGGQALVYSIRCVSLSPSKLEVELTCLGESETFLVGLMGEIGWRLKTHVAVSQVRCIRYGFFTLEHALLMKHVDLENVLNNIYLNSQMLQENAALIASSANFQEPTVKEDLKE